MVVNEYIRLALKLVGAEGIGQVPDAEDQKDVLTILQAMLGQWNRRRWLIFSDIDVACTATGAVSYSIPGDFATPRPDRIESAYVRSLTSPNPVDYALSVIEAHEDYASIMLKQLSSFPAAVFLDTAYPVASVFVWPVPLAGQYDIHLVLQNNLPQALTPVTDLALPAEYTDCIIWNLAVRIAPIFGLDPNPTTITLAVNSLNTIRTSNAQIPRMGMPSGLPGTSGGRWPGHGVANYGGL